MLLPAAVASIEQLSLQAHLALHALSLGAGSKPLLVELYRVIYMSWFLREAGVGDAQTPLYTRSDKVLENVAIRAAREGIWRIPDADVSVLQHMLAIYDTQIAKAPMFLMQRCQRQLQTHLRIGKGTPWPSF
jgi:hypothetical protein